MKECQKKVKNILAICWGMQVAVTAAGGEVKKATNSHIGIANEIMLSKDGLNHPFYKDKIINLIHQHLTLMKLLLYLKMVFV